MNTADDKSNSALSVVIASFSGEVALRRCLDSLMPQTRGAEVIVAFRSSLSPSLLTDDRFRDVRFVPAPADANVFQLRSIGVRDTSGALIVWIECHSVVG